MSTLIRYPMAIQGLPSSSLARLLMAGLIPVIFIFLFLGPIPPALAQEDLTRRPDYSRNPEWFPHINKPYVPARIPDLPLGNTGSLTKLITAGKVRLSLADLRAAVRDNNLDIVSASINTAFAETDLLRAKGGGAPRGVPGVQIPSSLFSGAIGAGLGSAAGLGGFGSAGGISGGARAVTVRASGSLDPTFLLNYSIDRSSSPLNTVRVSGIPTVSTATTALQARYVQAFTTGTTISLTFNNQRQSSTQQYLLYNPDFVSSFSFSFTQQLLNGFGFAVNRRFLSVARNERVITNEAYRQQVSTTLALAQNAYWDLVAARENVGVAEKSLAVSQKLLEENKMREEIGTLARLDVIQAESEVASRQRDLVVAQTNFQLTEVSLKNVLSKEIDAALGSAPIETTDPLPDPKDSDIPKLTEALAAAMRNRPEIKQDEGNIQNQGIAIQYTKDLLKPTLALFGLFGSSGLFGDQVIPNPNGGAPIVLPGGITQAFRQVRSFSYPEYAFGLSLSIPLLNRSAQADSIRGRLEERQAEIQLQHDRSQIALEVRTALIGLVQAKAQVEAAHQTVVLNAETLSAEEQKLLSGVSTSYKVILQQRDLLAAQLAEVQARTTYAKALVELDRSTGALDSK
jgi:outer membrane protein